MRSLIAAFPLRLPRLGETGKGKLLPIMAVGAVAAAVGMVGLMFFRSAQATADVATAWTSSSERLSRSFVAASAALGVTLQQVTITGRVHTAGADILGALDLPQGGPLLALDPEAARDQVQSLPWVKEAIVERQLPNQVHIKIKERIPIALWQSPDGHYHLIDVEGVPIADSYAGFGGMLVVVGDGAPKVANDLLLMLATEPEIAQRVKAAVRFGQRRWDLWIDGYAPDGIQVRLPERDPAQGLERLLKLEHEQQILQRDVAMIDLRLDDRLVVLPVEHPDATPAAKGKGAVSKTSAPGEAGKKPLPLTGKGQDA